MSTQQSEPESIHSRTKGVNEQLLPAEVGQEDTSSLNNHPLDGHPQPDEPQAIPRDPNTLIVNDISRSCTSDEFTAIFDQFGPLRSAKIVKDRRKPHHRGFGFVTFEQPKDAQRACAALHLFDLYEKPLSVQFAFESYSTLASGSHGNLSLGSATAADEQPEQPSVGDSHAK